MDSTFDKDQALSLLESALGDGKLTAGAAENIRVWLTEPHYAEYAPQVAQHLAEGKWQALDDAFWTIIPFGTGGRRGKMYPIGSNAINDRTIGESAQGLADYTKQQFPGESLRCVIAYDTRHRSRHFAELCAGIMAASGYKVYFLDGYRSTPALSFAVRRKRGHCGIMITASHNPPSDNAVKAYWASGCQLLPPHDRGVIDCVMSTREIERIDFAEGLASGQIEYCQDEIDAAFIEAVAAQSLPGPRNLKIIYSPLHGVGTSAVCPALAASGFRDVEVFGPHATPDGDFPNVPQHVSNPENPAVFDMIIDRAKEVGADLVMATDPDCDRVGCAGPKSLEPGAEWTTITGNQIGALMTDYLLSVGNFSPEHYVVKTLVTTELVRRIADAHGVETVGDLLVGFKWIGGVMEERDASKFIVGTEESYGFLVGSHCRDKDAAVGAMVLAELTARAKADGKTIYQKLHELFATYGCHSERTIPILMPGSEGMARMKEVMAQFRQSPPESLGGLKIARIRDYAAGTVTEIGGAAGPLEGPTGDLVIFDLEAEGNYLAARPSGTEPKVKFYLFAYDPPAEGADPEAVLARQAERLTEIEKDLRKFAGVE